MTEIVMLVWLGDVANNVAFMLGLLLLLCCVFAAVLAALMLTGLGFYEHDYKVPRGLVRSVAVGAAISALALALIPSRDTIYLYAAARAVQIAETTELGSEVYAALLRTLREVSPAK